MPDMDLSELETRLKGLLEKKDAIRRKILEYSEPAAPEVQSDEDIKPIFHKGRMDKQDELNDQLAEINSKIHDIEIEIKLRKAGIY
jgi:hypothetical protein